MCAAKVGELAATNDFITKLDSPTTDEEFEALIPEVASVVSDTEGATASSDEEVVNLLQMKHYNSEDVNPMASSWAEAGYQPYEPVATDPPRKWVTIHRSGLFGQCSDVPYISFMDSLPVEQCSFKPQEITKEFCEQTLSIAPILDMVIYSDPSGGSVVPVDVSYSSGSSSGGINKFEFREYTTEGARSYSLFKQLEETTDAEARTTANGFPDATYDDSDGACDNFALEYHIKIQFQDASTSSIAAYQISKVDVDVVYGKITPESPPGDAAARKYTIPRKTSVTFY